MQINITPYAIPGIVKKGSLKSQIIINAVCDYFVINKKDLSNKSRERNLVLPRHIAMYLIKTKTKATYLSIGQIFKRDHSTVINAMDKINGFLDIKDDITVDAIDAILNNIRTNS